MADDIDIEEHDILDNPVLKRIFPDISIVKKEILKDYEDVPDIKQEEDISINENSINETACFEDKLKISSHVPSTNVEDKSNLDITQNQTQSVTPLLSNKIILGSKPVNTLKDTNKTEAVIRLPRVILQDIKSFLHQNDRFCKDCQIIFSSRLNFDDHRLNVHSITTKNIQGHNIPKIKPNNHKCNVCDICFTSSSSLSEHSKTVHKKQSHICSICKNCFSTLTNLYRHYRNIHKKKFSLKAKLKNKLSTINANTTPHITSRKTKPSGKGTKLEENKISLNVCSHCNKSFPDQKSLIDHIYTVLEPKHHIKSNNKTVISQKKKAYASTHQMKTKKSNRKVTSHIIAKRNGRQSWSSKLVFENDEIDDDITGIMKEMDHEESNEIKASNKEQSTNGAQSNKIGLMLKADEDLDLISVRSTRSKNKRNYKKLEDEIEIKSSLLSKNQETSKIEDDMFLSEPLKKKVRKEKQRPCASSSTKQISKGSKNDITKKNKFTVHFNASINRSKSKTKTNQARNIHDIPYIDSKEITTKIDSHKIKKCGIQGKFVFECIYCSYIVPTARAYYMHVLGKHKIEKVSKVNRVRFNEQCKYCPSKSITVNGHNKHIYTYHDDLYRNMPNECISEDDENDHTQHENIRNPIFEKYKSFVLESVIYKCNRCDIYFLSSFIAKDHKKHMEMLVNWKCKQCARIFKKHDKQLHLKQHNFTKTLSVCQFNESELSALLYSCTKCAIHFTEDRYIEHYSNCDKETTDSVYCKACDILIDKPGYNNHEVHHKNGKKNFDFTIIVADIIADINKQENGSQKKRKRLYEQYNCLTFCKTCKCYLSDIAITRKTHIESRCASIPKYTCNMCGLVFTNVSIRTHRDKHKTDPNLTVQDFKFFDLHGIQIKPPIPEYPRCNNCKVHFINKNAVKLHVCSETKSVNCTVCAMKLSENAFKLHFKFHHYSINDANNKAPPVVVGSNSRKQEPDFIKENEINIKDCVTQIQEIEPDKRKKFCNTQAQENEPDKQKNNCDTQENEPGKQTNSFITKENEPERQNKYCDTQENEFKTQNNKCDTQENETEKQKNNCDTQENETEKQNNYCDTQEKEPEEQKNNCNTQEQDIVADKQKNTNTNLDSESRSKLDNIQIFLYSCLSCKFAVDSYDKVVDHCQNHYSPVTKTTSLAKICNKCSLKFESVSYDNHQIIHSSNATCQLLTYDPSYFVSGNDIWTRHIFRSIQQSEEKKLVSESIYRPECRIKMDVVQKGPSYLTVYKCDKCGNFIDPNCLLKHVKSCTCSYVMKYPCSTCGLPFMSLSMRKQHEQIHRDYENIRIKSYNIVLINNEAHNNYNNSILDAIKQYALYQCRSCDGVVDKLERNVHRCAIDNLKKCSICKLLIYNDNYNMHISKHTNLPRFKAENMKVILFGKQTELSLKKTLMPSFSGMVYDYTLYKCCKCDVHFKNILMTIKHVCIPDDSKFKCPKCGFFFTARLLKGHLDMHNLDPEYNIENIKIVVFND